MTRIAAAIEAALDRRNISEQRAEWRAAIMWIFCQKHDPDEMVEAVVASMLRNSSSFSKGSP